VFRNQDSVRKLYKSARWRVTRFLVLVHDVLCASCGNQAATEVDHIVLARTVLEELGIDEFFNPDRCQGLCHECHSRKTAFECWGFTGNGGTAITAAELEDRCNNVTVVCGLPASGKTMYIRTHAQEGDLVWDYDAELAAATGRDEHGDTLNGVLQSMLAQRDTFVRRARWSTSKSWIIVTRRDSTLVKLLEAAGATVVLCEVDEAIRLQRLAARIPCAPPSA
jgi:hypothetical protein